MKKERLKNLIKKELNAVFMRFYRSFKISYSLMNLRKRADADTHNPTSAPNSPSQICSI